MIRFSAFPAFAAVLCAATFISCSSPEIEGAPASSSAIQSSSSVYSLSSSSRQGKPSSSSSVASSSSSSSVLSSSSETNDPDLLSKKTITLSLAGSSYADIDGNITTYQQASAATASIRNKIDLIAYCGSNTWCVNNSIYTPWEIGLFWTDENDFLGSDNVIFFEIPAEQAEIFKTATKLSEIIDPLNDLIEYINYSRDSVDEIPIEAGKVFFVYTSEENIRIVVIKSTGSQSVTLEVIQIPD